LAVIVPHPVTATDGLSLIAAVVAGLGLIAATTGPGRRYFIPIGVTITRTVVLILQFTASTMQAAQAPRNGWGRVSLTGYSGKGSRGGGLFARRRFEIDLARRRFEINAYGKYAADGPRAQARRQIWPATSASLLAGPGLIMTGT
jgi:hypothetical protein